MLHAENLPTSTLCFLSSLQRDRPCFVDLLHILHLAELIFIIFDFDHANFRPVDKLEGLLAHLEESQKDQDPVKHSSGQDFSL